MKKNKDNIAGDFFIYTLLGFLPLSFSFFFIPVYTTYLSVEEYGVFNYFTVISGLLIPITSLSIEQAAGFLYWDYKDVEKKRNFILNILILFLLVFFVITVLSLVGLKLKWITFSFDDNGFSKAEFLMYALLFAFSTNMCRFFLSIYRNEKQLLNYSILNISYFVALIIGTVIGLILLKQGLKGAIEGRTLGFLIVIIAAMLCFFIKQNRSFSFDFKIMKSAVVISIPLLFSQVIGSVAFSLDRLMIEKHLSLSLLGIYSLAYSLSYILDIILNALSNTLIPDVFRKMKNGDAVNHRIIYGWFDFSLLISSVFGLLGFLYIYVFISYDYYESLSIVLILSLSIIPKSIQQYYNLYFYKDNKTRMMLVLNIVYLLVVSILIFSLGSYFSIKGVALAVLFTNWFSVIFLKYLLKEKVEIKINRYIYISAVFLLYYGLITESTDLFNINFALSILMLLAPFLILLIYYYLFEKRKLFCYIISVKNIKYKYGRKISNY